MQLIMLERLKHHHLNFTALGVPHPQVHFFSLLDLAELFSKTVDLKLVMPDRTRELSIESVADADPWTIAIPDVEPQALSLASDCQGLKEIVISSDRDSSVSCGSYRCSPPAEAVDLLGFLPTVVSLDLGGLTSHSATLVQQWLEDDCERRSKFSFFCDDDEGDESEAEGDEEYQEDDGEEY
ncbi:hypothetical protein BGZ49_010345 [Haplosporangium sp. Z 27]|nr:hypothetical protein BGZ49_010345 [Haplosporangium sp. Z 27]